METLNKGDIEILTFGSFIGNHFVRENGKYVFQIEDSEMNRLGAKFDILEVFAIFKDNLLRDKYKIGRRENSSQPEIVPVQEEVGAIAVKISDNLNPKLSATEQAFFIAGFEEAVKYFKLINSTQQTAHLQQQLKEAKEKIQKARTYIHDLPEMDYDSGQALMEREKPCANCKETIAECACMRNICVKCNKPVGNITFSHCDKCFDILHSEPTQESVKERNGDPSMDDMIKLVEELTQQTAHLQQQLKQAKEMIIQLNEIIENRASPDMINGI